MVLGGLLPGYRGLYRRRPRLIVDAERRGVALGADLRHGAWPPGRAARGGGRAAVHGDPTLGQSAAPGKPAGPDAAFQARVDRRRVALAMAGLAEAGRSTAALRAFRRGDFSVRLPRGLSGAAGNVWAWLWPRPRMGDRLAPAPELGDDAPLGAGQHSIESHIAGNLWQVCVLPGQMVSAGETLAILESMKMEIPLTAPRDGTVKDVKVAVGAVVDEGQALVTLE